MPFSEEELDAIDKRLSVHEAVCAERWRETITRIKRLEHIFIGATAAIILLLANLLIKLN
jgi:cell division protein FtsL